MRSSPLLRMDFPTGLKRRSLRKRVFVQPGAIPIIHPYHGRGDDLADLVAMIASDVFRKFSQAGGCRFQIEEVFRLRDDLLLPAIGAIDGTDLDAGREAQFYKGRGRLLGFLLARVGDCDDDIFWL